MLPILASLGLLVLCAVRYQQLVARRAQRAEERQRKPSPAPRPATLKARIVEPEMDAKARWVAQAVKSNPGLTPEAAGALYERLQEREADPTTF